MWRSETLARAARGHSWGRSAGTAWGPGSEMFRSFQRQTEKEKEQNEAYESHPSHVWTNLFSTLESTSTTRAPRLLQTGSRHDSTGLSQGGPHCAHRNSCLPRREDASLTTDHLPQGNPLSQKNHGHFYFINMKTEAQKSCHLPVLYSLSIY